MKQIKLIKKKPSERLVNLVDEIPELKIYLNTVQTLEGAILYDTYSNSISFPANDDSDIKHENNPLLNKKLLSEAVCKNDIFYVSNNDFCDILEQHIYLKNVAKMNELFPQIQEWYPDAYMEETKEKNEFRIFSGEGHNQRVISCIGQELMVLIGHGKIWEDKENLIVKKKNPMPEIKRGYSINRRGNCVICVDDSFGEYTTIEDCTVIDTFVDEEIKTIYNEDDELIWEREK